MSKVGVIVVIYNAAKYIKPVFDAIFAQTFKNFEVIAVINGSIDGSKELIEQSYPRVRVIDPGNNLWFAKGNNLAIKESDGEFIQLVNQDLILEPDYIEKILKAFDDLKVAAATGKLLRFDFGNNQKTNIIDSTGHSFSASGRVRDRGQLEADRGQYDNERVVFGVSGAGSMYRKSAIESIKYCSDVSLNLSIAQNRGTDKNSGCEYFDEDFVAYWEDADLSWRLNNAGFKNVYVPEAVGFHGRTAGQAKGGYLHFWHFIRHHSNLSTQIRQLNYKNHILMYIKNAKFIMHPAFVLREVAMLLYILLLEQSTLKIIPELIRQIPKIWKKRKYKIL